MDDSDQKKSSPDALPPLAEDSPPSNWEAVEKTQLETTPPETSSSEPSFSLTDPLIEPPPSRLEGAKNAIQRARGFLQSKFTRKNLGDPADAAVSSAEWGTLPFSQRLRVKLGAWSASFAQNFKSFDPKSTQIKNPKNLLFAGRAITLLVCTWFLADLVSIGVSRWIPEPPVTRARTPIGRSEKIKTIQDYNVIFTRNLFNSDGIIPGEDASSSPIDPGGAPVKTSLPFQLIGTLILQDELRSIATIEDKTASAVYPVRVQDEIPSKAKIIQIEARKVIFLNIQSGRREYVDLPEAPLASKVQISTSPSIKSAASGTSTIEKLSPTQFNISRVEVDKTLADLNRVLTEARAVPNIENGVPSGYKLFQIVPGSIYDKLGLKNGDVITGLNGEAVNDPTKAMALLSELRDQNTKSLSLSVKSGGKVMNYQYDIR